MRAGSTALTRGETIVAALASIVLAVGLLGLHIVSGAFYSDDWTFAAIRATHSGFGLLRAFASATDGQRPVLALYFPAIFTSLGLNPHAHLACVAVLTGALGFGIYVVLRMLRLSASVACAVGILVVAFPFDDSTKLWTTGGVIQFALVVYVAGVILALRGFESAQPRARVLHCGSIALYAVSILTYEATVGLVVCTIGVYLAKTRVRRAVVRWLSDIAVVAPLMVLVLARTPKTVHHGIGYQLHHITLITQSAAVLMGGALCPWAAYVGPVAGGAAIVLAICLIIGAVALGGAEFRASRNSEHRRRIGQALLITIAGLVAIAAGYVAFVPASDGYSPGPALYNRVNAASSIGYALLAVGAISLVAEVLVGSAKARSAAMGLAVATVFAGYTYTLVRDELLWNQAGRAERVTVLQLSRSVPASLRSDAIYVWDTTTSLAPNLPVFDSTWDLPNAMRIAWHRRQARVFPMLDKTGFRCGASRMYPTHGLYGEAFGAPYGHGVFAAPTLRHAVRVTSRSECRSLVTRLLRHTSSTSTPTP